MNVFYKESAENVELSLHLAHKKSGLFVGCEGLQESRNRARSYTINGNDLRSKKQILIDMFTKFKEDENVLTRFDIKEFEVICAKISI